MENNLNFGNKKKSYDNFKCYTISEIPSCSFFFFGMWGYAYRNKPPARLGVRQKLCGATPVEINRRRASALHPYSAPYITGSPLLITIEPMPIASPTQAIHFWWRKPLILLGTAPTAQALRLGLLTIGF